jgi:hypothetical protein
MGNIGPALSGGLAQIRGSSNYDFGGVNGVNNMQDTSDIKAGQSAAQWAITTVSPLATLGVGYQAVKVDEVLKDPSSTNSQKQQAMNDLQDVLQKPYEVGWNKVGNAAEKVIVTTEKIVEGVVEGAGNLAGDLPLITEVLMIGGGLLLAGMLYNDFKK